LTTRSQDIGRILALDYGKRRIGLAISDELGITAQPLPTYTRRRLREDLTYLKNLIAEKGIRLLVFGDPKYMSGDESPLGAEMKEFAARLEELAVQPVVFWDERLTSSEAHRMLSGEKLTRQERKGKVDSIAAILILQSYLHAQDAAGGEPEEGE
jgi:putative Holliday junction resolvase